MGCVSSRSCAPPEPKDVSQKNKINQENNGVEILEKTRSAKFGGVSVRYGFLSQRGFYPDESDKPNQDSYSITQCLGGEESDAMFAVYDGHGRHGDLCAQYARDSLPTLISNYSKKMKKKNLSRRNSNNSHNNSHYNNNNNNNNSTERCSLSKDQISTACSIAHRNCNLDLHRNDNIPDSLSGTTAISCLFHGEDNRIVVSNVGDSRAVLGQKIERKGGGRQGKDNVVQSYRALPLSSDQTPYRADERTRIRATGARILSLDQIEGLEPIRSDEEQYSVNDPFMLGEEIDEGGDPPRVWSPHGDYPGTAFTRSFGDSIAEQLGVFAEPEVLLRDLTPDDRIIVLATDGVFEFLTNQSVIDICAKFDDPLEACRAVVAESYELWLQYELRTDDITMICIFVDSIEDSSTGEQPISNANEQTHNQETSHTPTGSRPVHLRLSKNASKSITQMKNNLIDDCVLPENFYINEHYTTKTEDEQARILKAIESVTMLKTLTPEGKDMVIGLMEPISVKKGDWVIRQGTVGDRFFIVDDGCFEVRKVQQGDDDDTGTGGPVVHTYNGSRELSRFPTFGEFALINSAPRAASIIAQTDGYLWALHKFSFREVFAAHDKRQTLLEALRKIPELSKLEKDEINTIAEGMEEITFDAGNTIVRKGDTGSTFYVIQKGTCAANTEIAKEKAESPKIQQEAGNCVEVISEEITTNIKTILANTEITKEDAESPNIHKNAGNFFGEEVMSEETTTYNTTIVANTEITCWVGNVDLIASRDE